MLSLFILLPFLLILILHALSYFARYLELARKPDYGGRRPWSLRGGDFIPFLMEYGFILATFSLLLVDLALGPLLRPFQRRVRKRGDVGTPIILIHGLGMRPLTMLPLYLRLTAAGRKNIHFLGYGRPANDIFSFSKSLDVKIKKSLELSAGAPLHLICHSLGGLVAREFLMRGGGEGVSSLITLGTPHGGTSLWAFAPGGIGKQLKPGSSLLLELDAKGPPQGLRAFAIYSDFDALVLPPERGRWEAAGVKNVKLEGVGHSGLLFSRKVFREILNALEGK